VNGTDSAVRGTGFMPGTRAYVWLMSNPTFLGEVTVRADGSFSGSVPIDGVPTGEHTLQLSGVGTDGFVRAANLGVVLVGDGMPRPTRLPAGEGPVPTLPLTAALALLVTGLIALLAERERSAAAVLAEATARLRRPIPGKRLTAFDALQERLEEFRRTLRQD